MSGPGLEGPPEPPDAVKLENEGTGTHQNGQQGPAGAEEGEGELETSFFPNPPNYYKRYTTANLALPRDSQDVIEASGASFRAAELDPPDVEAVVERGMYDVFGQTWPVVEASPSLQDMGVQVLYDPSQDRKQSLQTLLRALVMTYLQLVRVLQKPPPSFAQPQRLPDGSEAPTEASRLIDHLRLIGVNMHHLVNELRPVQARESLRNMLLIGTEERKAKTAATRQRCEEIETTLTKLRETVSTAVEAATLPPFAHGPTQDVQRLPLDQDSYDLDRLRALTQ